MRQNVLNYKVAKRSRFDIRTLLHPQRKDARSMWIFAKIGTAAGYTAAIIQVIAFLLYCFEVFSKQAHTNPVTWWLWLGETLVGLLIYADRTQDRPKWITEAVAFVGVILVSLYLGVRMYLGDSSIIMESVESVDYLAAATAVGAFCFWLATRKRWGPSASIWVFQIALISAAFPLIRATLANPSAEPFWPWALWTLSFIFQLVCSLLRWDGFEPLVNPLNYAITHGVVALIIIGAISL